MSTNSDTYKRKNIKNKSLINEHISSKKAGSSKVDELNPMLFDNLSDRSSQKRVNEEAHEEAYDIQGIELPVQDQSKHKIADHNLP